MKCTSCGSDFASDQLKCPYCGTINEYALRMAKELQTYDAAYEKKRDELLKTGANQVLKHLTIGLGIAFLIILVISFGFVCFLQYRTTYEVKGARLKKNKETIERYLEEKQYIRAYLLATSTDPTGEHFEYYPEYEQELTIIYNYSILLVGVLQSMDAMDEGDNYPSLRDTDLTSYQIFYYNVGEDAVGKDLTREVDRFLKDYYRLTEEEVEALKEMGLTDQFTLNGSADIEAVTKERMEEYFGK